MERVEGAKKLGKRQREIETVKAVLHFHGVTMATAAQERRRGALLPSQRLAAEY